MATRLEPQLHRMIAKFGGGDVDACMNCGNCTAICPLSTESESFPRKVMHFLQIGNQKRLMESADPWLCYYCGECSESCPREAQPGETMMAARRYLTSLYDWTGLAKRLYTSIAWEISAIIAVGLLVVVLFYFLHGPMETDSVKLNTFAPAVWVELGDWAMAAVLSFFLLTNAFRMYIYIMRSKNGLKIPLWLYIRELITFVWHFATQKRTMKCTKSWIYWLTHFLLVTGYMTMLTLVVIFLRWFQTDVVHPAWHPQRWVGYYATAALLYGTVYFTIGRLTKREQVHKYSEPSDWIFLILLFLTSLTGIMVHGARLAGFPLTTYYVYVIHLAIAVPMLVVEVPFSKWSHLLYRPLAVYLTTVKQKGKKWRSGGQGESST